MGGDTLVESRLLTGANGLPNNRPSSMHHRSFDRIAGSSFEIAKGGEKKKKNSKENNNSAVYTAVYIHRSFLRNVVRG